MIPLLGQGLLAVAAGVLLNLTPCVLPAIPLKIRAILNATGAEARQRFYAATAFLAGSVGLFAALGAFAASLRLRWGFLFQSRLFLALLILALLLAGLATFFDWTLALPQSLYRIRGGRHLEPFLAGLLTGVLASPCTGPFLGGVLAFGVTQPPPVVFTLFILIGLGLALPYILLLLWPALLPRLPAGGRWTLRVKELLAFILWAGAVFFARSLLPPAWAGSAWGLWGAGLVLWAGLAWRREENRRVRLFPAASAALGLLLLFVGSVHLSGTPLPWEPYSPGALAAVHGDRPALIEFTADWCLNCKVLEKTVYADPLVLTAAREVRIAAFRVDLTESDEIKESLLASYGGAGLPFAVVLDAEGEVVKALPDLFTAGALERAIRLAAVKGKSP